MMPLLHSYLTVDTDSFLARPERINGLIEIIVNVFKNETGEDDQAHAAKLFECLLLQCQVNISILRQSQQFIFRFSNEISNSYFVFHFRQDSAFLL